MLDSTMDKNNQTEGMEAGIFLAEENFQREMAKRVEPFLAEYRQEGILESYDGTRIFYRTYILPDAKAQIVISHGFCEFADKYNELIYYFLQEGYSIYIPEHRGHGHSGRSIDDLQKVQVGSYQEYIEDLHFFLEHVVKKVSENNILFAHSMGGAIGTLYLETYPGDFQAAVLSAPMFGMQTGKYPRLAAKAVARVHVKTGRGEQYAAGQHGFTGIENYEHSSSVSLERYRYVFRKRMENPRYQTYGGTYQWVLASLQADERLMRKSNLEQIRIPILLFDAGLDHMLQNRAIREFARRTRQTRLIEMPQAKHEIFNAGETVRRKYYSAIFRFLRAQLVYMAS